MKTIIREDGKRGVQADARIVKAMSTYINMIREVSHDMNSKCY